MSTESDALIQPEKGLVSPPGNSYCSSCSADNICMSLPEAQKLLNQIMQVF